MNKIEQTIKKIRELDAAPGRIGGPELRERAVMAATGSFQGARVKHLNASLRAELADLGVVGANGGLTAHGANVRARLINEQLDRLMPL